MSSFIEPFKPTSGTEPFKTGPRKEPFGHGSSNEPFNHQTASPALVADALSSATAAVVRLTDADAQLTPKTTSDPLWRRDDWVRITLAQQELLSGLRHAHDSLWWVPDMDGMGKVAAAGKLLTLVPPDSATLTKQLRLVLARRDERPDRHSEILVQIADFWPFWTAITGIDPTRAPRTHELMQVAASLSPAVGQCFKHALNVPRPVALSTLVQPVIAAPGHAAYPSGHATGAFIFVYVLQTLLGQADTAPLIVQLTRMAQRIADNRVVAGVHYPMDSDAGRALARNLADCLVARARSGKVGAGTVVDPNAGSVKPGTTAVAIAKRPVLAAMWVAAKTELGV